MTFSVGSPARAGDESSSEQRSMGAQWAMKNFNLDPQELLGMSEEWLANHYRSNLAISAGTTATGAAVVRYAKKLSRDTRALRWISRGGKYAMFKGLESASLGGTGFVLAEWYPEVTTRSIKETKPASELVAPVTPPERASSAQ